MRLDTQKLNGRPTKETLAKILQIPKQICWFGDPVLRCISAPFSTEELNNLSFSNVVEQLLYTTQQIIQRLGIGKGLSAPQIGISKRVFVIFKNDDGKFDVFINPVITRFSEIKSSYREMCLSGIPLSGVVIRPWEIDFEYFDENCIFHKVTAAPMLSRVVQHEVDHLNGILYIDKVDTKTLSFEFNRLKFKTNNLLTIIN